MMYLMAERNGGSDGGRKDSSSESEPLDLGDDAIRVLVAIDALGGEATTSEVRPEVDFDVSVPARKIKYQVSEYLEPAGLVESFQPEGNTGEIPPKEYTLTESGESYLESYEGDIQSERVDGDRLAQLEARIDDLEAENERLREQVAETESGAAGGVDEDTIAELEQRLDGFDAELDEIDDYLDEFDRDILNIMDEVEPLMETVDELEQTVAELDSHPLLRDGDGIAAVNRALILGNTLQVLLNGKDLITAEMVEDQYERRAQVLAENDRLLPDE